MKYSSQLAIVAFCCLLTASVLAQDRDSRRGGPSGGRGGFGDRGGRSPSGFGDRGRGSGGDRSGFGDRGGFGGPGRGFGGGPGGGPPGGFGGPGRGFGGGPPSGFGGPGRTFGSRFGAGPGSVENSRGGSTAARSSGNRPQPITPYRQSDKERVTIDLPPKYSELDTDFDGQVGMYEWMTVRRETLDQFDEIDANLDGILTPRELKAFDEIASSTDAKVTTYKRERLTIVGGSGSSGSSSRGRSGGTDGRGSSSGSSENREKYERYSQMSFGMMDKNKNGRIDMEEWEASRRVRPMFESAGIKIEAMDRDSFMKKFVETMEKREQKGR